MNFDAQHIKFSPLSVFSLFIAVEILIAILSPGAQSPTSRPCSSSEYREFDFWVGDWKVFDIGSPRKVADVQVEAILDGCVLREDYRGADGHRGQSFTIYDAARKVWHQTWVTNRGELLQIEGKVEDGEMVLTGRNQQGALVRGTWKPVNRDVRETAVTSTDGGRTWQPWFDLVFRRSASSMTKMDAGAYDGRDTRKIALALVGPYPARTKGQ
jgi:hypothetical protein